MVADAHALSCFLLSRYVMYKRHNAWRLLSPGISDAAKAAATAEVSLIFVGTISGEGADRATLSLGNIDTNNCRKPCHHTPPGDPPTTVANQQQHCIHVLILPYR